MWIYVKLCEADVVEIWIGTYRNSIGTASEHHGLQCSDVDQILIRCCSDLLESEPISEQIFWNRCVSRMPWPTFIFAFLEPWLGWSKTRSPETLWDTLRHSETWSICGSVERLWGGDRCQIWVKSVFSDFDNFRTCYSFNLENAFRRGQKVRWSRCTERWFVNICDICAFHWIKICPRYSLLPRVPEMFLPKKELATSPFVNGLKGSP